MERATVQGIEVFLTIVREGSLRAAAKALGVGPPAVSLQLKALEERMGVGLLHRTTRSIELTDAGRVLFDAAAPAYRDMVYAVKKTREVGRSTTGTLRLTLSRGAYVATVAPVLEAFQADNPGISLDLSLNERLVDIIHDGFHAGIRLGDVLAPDMVAVRLTPPQPSAYFAAPSYLRANGRPEEPRDLLDHRCIRNRLPTANRIADWPIIENGQNKTIDPPASLVFDHTIGVIDAARDGHGIGWAAFTSVQDRLASGELETVLDSHAGTLPPFYLYYPEQNRRVECLRLFIDCLVTRRDRQARTATSNDARQDRRSPDSIA